jgi:hypothetical protein
MEDLPHAEPQSANAQLTLETSLNMLLAESGKKSRGNSNGFRS